MATATAPETGNSTQYSLNNPPTGFYFDWDEVKGDHGQVSFGKRPLLTVNEDPEGAKALYEFYGNEGVARFYNGTSGRVQFQGVARRVTAKGKKEGWSDEKINEEIAKQELEYRPGKRAGGQSTAQSRAVAAMKKAAGKIPGDALAGLMDRVAAMTDEQRLAFGQQFGIDFSQVTENGDEEEGEEQDEAAEATTQG